jgi:hypothetical protein
VSYSELQLQENRICAQIYVTTQIPNVKPVKRSAHPVPFPPFPRSEQLRREPIAADGTILKESHCHNKSFYCEEV